MRNSLILIVTLLLFSHNSFAQCNTTGFTVQSTNTTCSANGTIKVTIPTSTDCTGWIAEIVKQGGGSSSINFPLTGGQIIFSSLGIGSYDLRLTNGVTSIDYPSNPIVISSNYVDMRYSFSTSALPSCPNAEDAQVTATITSGTGIGPFIFKLVSPTQGTFVSPPQTSRKYTFTGLKGGQNVDLSITDKIDSSSGCEITVNRPGFAVANVSPSTSNLAFNGTVRGLNFYKNCSTSPCSVDMVVNIANVTASKLAKLNEAPLNAKVTIAGVDYALELVSSNLNLGIAQYKYNPTTTGGPLLYHGTNIKVNFVDVCGDLSMTKTINMPENDFANLYVVASSNPTTCQSTYTLRIENFHDDGSYRSIAFCPQNKLIIQKLRSTNPPDYYTDLTSAEVTPDPNRNSNPLSCSTTVGNSIAGGRAEYTLTDPGTYKIIASDNCHTITRYYTVNALNSVLQNSSVVEVPSVLQGTSALTVNFGTVSYKSPIHIKIKRADGKSLVGYDATAPFQLKGQKYINFPIERDYAYTDGIARSYTVTDLPLGSYIVELTNAGCPSTEFVSVSRSVTLSKPAEYALLDGNIATNDSPVKVKIGCLGTSQITFDMGKNANVVSSGSTELWTATAQGAPVARVGIGVINSLTGTFSNLYPGNYLVRVVGIYNGYSSAEESVNNPPAGPWEYSVPVTIDPITPIRVEASTIFCDQFNPNSGIVNVEITSGTVTYPLSFTLYSKSDPSTPVSVADNPFVFNEDVANLNIRSVSFTDVPQGSYFVRTATPCYSVDTNVDLSAVSTVPVAKTDNSVLCAGSPAKLSIYTTKNLYTVFWTKKDDTAQLGTGSSITVRPTVTTTYTAHYKILPVYNCADTEFTSDVTVNVLPVDLTLDVTPSQIELCGNANATTTLTVKNTATGINYEIVDTNGNSFTPILKQSGSNGTDLTFNVPNNKLVAGTNLKIRPTSSNASASCTAYLDKQVAIVSSSKRSDLTVIGSSVCPNVAGSITIQSAENGVQYEVLRDGASLSPAIRALGTGGNLILTVPASQLLNASNTFTIKASFAGCTPVILNNQAIIIKLASPSVNAGVDFTRTCVTNPSGKQIGMTSETGNTYSWTASPVSNSLSATNISNPVASPIISTEYTLTVTNSTTGCTASDKVLVTVNLGAPAINAGADYTKTCVANLSGKTIGTTAVSGVNYIWSNASNSNIATTSTLFVNPSTTTEFTLTATYQNGCTASDNVLVTVDNVAHQSPTISSITQPTCTVNTGTIEVTSTGVSSDLYSIDNGTFQSGTTFSNVAIGSHTLRIKSANGCISDPTSVTINAQPPTPAKPTISNNTGLVFCEGGSVTLTSSSATGNQWFKNGVAIPNETNQNLVVTTSGDYTLNVTNNSNCTSSISEVTTVTVNELPIATINNDSHLDFLDCSTAKVILKASPGVSYVWYYSADNGATFTELPGKTGDVIEVVDLGFYKVKVIGVNCEAISQPTHIIASPSVTPANIETCAGNTHTLDVDTNDFVNPTFQWNKDGQPIPNATSSSFTASEEGTYTVTVTDGRTTGNIGTKVSCASRIKINPLPTVSAGLDATITCVENASGVTIGEDSVTGFDYLWTSDSGALHLSNSTISNPLATPTTSTIYTVTKTNKTTLCSSQKSVTVTVDIEKPLVNAGSDFTKNCLINTSGSNIGSDPHVGVTYSWTPDINIVGLNTSNPFVNPSTSTKYIVTALSSRNGCIATDEIDVTVDLSTEVANAGQPFTITCMTNVGGKTIGSDPVTGVSYLWSPTDGLDSPTKANPLANPTQTTTYSLVTTKDSTGCKSTASSVVVTLQEIPNATAIANFIQNSCPVETVDLTSIEPSPISGFVYEWWTGTSTNRISKIANPSAYNVAGKVYLWTKSLVEDCYNLNSFEVAVNINVCCLATVGKIENNVNSVLYSPANITGLIHTEFESPSVIRYVIVNDLDGKIKQINNSKPEFTNLISGNYTVHALVFGPTVTPTGLSIGNKLSQIQPQCGQSATYKVSVLSICNSNPTVSYSLANTKKYALLDLTTNKFVEVNSSGIFSTNFSGLPFQIVAFDYSSEPQGLVVGGTLISVSAANLDYTAGPVITGCLAVTTQIEGQIYNDKDKKCIEGTNDQRGLPAITFYTKLLNINYEVVSVSTPIQGPNYFFSMSPDLSDGTYILILDDNSEKSDSVASYPNSWKGMPKTITVISGQIVEQFSNTANFVPMCLQSATNKPILKPTANLNGNTYNYCYGEKTTSLSVDTIPGATANWYTKSVGGVASTTAPTPNTSVIGTTTYYVSQTVNGAESDRIEILTDVHSLPAQPNEIYGSNTVLAASNQTYSVLDSSNSLTYKWIIPNDWKSNSTTSKDINATVGNVDSIISVVAVSSFGCESVSKEMKVRIVIEDDIEVFNSVSPNNDGDNDFFRIRNIDFYPENTVSIFNRWGSEVFKTTSYGQTDTNVFRGISDGKLTIQREQELPDGTYFYILSYKNTLGIEKNLSGYLYLKR